MKRKKKRSEEMKRTIRTHLENVLYGLICAVKKKKKKTVTACLDK